MESSLEALMGSDWLVECLWSVVVFIVAAMIERMLRQVC